jgi:hypothetical protein
VAAAAPCLLLLAVLAATGRRQAGSVVGARSRSGTTTHRSVKATAE